LGRGIRVRSTRPGRGTRAAVAPAAGPRGAAVRAAPLHALVRRVLDDRARILGIRTGVARRAATLNGERGVHRHRAAGVVREGGDAVVAGGTVVEQVDRRAAEVVRVDHAVPATADLRRGVDVVAARGRGAGAAAAVAPAAGPRRAAVRTAPLHARAW